jgi:hypothetical protein
MPGQTQRFGTSLVVENLDMLLSKLNRLHTKAGHKPEAAR